MRKEYWLVLVAAFVLASALFLNYGIESHWYVIVKLRLVKWWGLIIVGVAIGLATLLFQTITQNPILTPSIIGFDALFVLLQTVLLLTLGGYGYVDLNIYLKFFIALVLMSVASLSLFLPLIRQLDLTRLILAGVIFSVLFRSIAAFLQRIIAPQDFLILQSELFARFNSINQSLLLVATILIIGLVMVIWRMRYILDILMLGKQHAIGLGVSYQRVSYVVLIIIALLVATSTALVGPMSFLGLLVCALVNQLVNHMHHRIRIPAVMLVSAVVLVAGQGVFEHLFGMKATLSVVIDCIGGALFLLLIQKNLKRTP